MFSDINCDGNKGFRLLYIYEHLNKGEYINKEELANAFGVSVKTIQRDIDDLRAYLAEAHFMDSEVEIKYSKSKKGYYLSKIKRDWLTSEEVLSTCKILLESRAFNTKELMSLIDKIVRQVAPEERKIVERIIRNEQQHYIPLRHGKDLMSILWKLSQYIFNNECIRFSYLRKDGVKKEHIVKPLALMFSEFYFYLICYMSDDKKKWPTVFRIDRMDCIKGTGETFWLPYKNRFEEGEFRKRVQFMYSGELRKVLFEYKGQSIEAVLDRLPTAEIISYSDGVYKISAESYGEGIFMWLRSQGDSVRVLDNIELRRDI